MSTNEAARELSDRYHKALLDDFREHGPAAIERVRTQSPAQYLRAIDARLPRLLKLLEKHDNPFSDYKTIEDFRSFIIDTVIENGWSGDVLERMKVVEPCPVQALPAK